MKERFSSCAGLIHVVQVEEGGDVVEDGWVGIGEVIDDNDLASVSCDSVTRCSGAAPLCP